MALTDSRPDPEGFPYTLLRVGLGIVFLYASYEKILSPSAFAQAVENYALLPPALIHPVALFLPWIEAVCGGLLIIGRLTFGATLIVDILMVIFILAFTINWVRGVDVSCGCFSLETEGQTGENAFYILRDLVILGAGLYVLYIRVEHHQRIQDDKLI